MNIVYIELFVIFTSVGGFVFFGMVVMTSLIIDINCNPFDEDDEDEDEEQDEEQDEG